MTIKSIDVLYFFPMNFAEHSAYVCLWNERASNIATDEILDEPLDFYDPYMQWYRRITRRFMSRRGAIAEALVSAISFFPFMKFHIVVFILLSHTSSYIVYM
ncbi:hypothetical protein Scep_009504 [Stephania cephalantha]|uniref:Uncharacterized protein n=1 Tax=Stephania cephalantha TaxID=152367 RepID=A0AAP0PCK9_9MAGN